MLIDQQIRELRKKARNAKNVDECYLHFEQLNKLQRQRFAEFGAFLPHSDGKVYTYDPEEDMWLRW